MQQTVGTAILTAIQAKYDSIEEISVKAKERRSRACFKGVAPDIWDNSFWKAIALMESERINMAGVK